MLTTRARTTLNLAPQISSPFNWLVEDTWSHIISNCSEKGPTVLEDYPIVCLQQRWPVQLLREIATSCLKTRVPIISVATARIMLASQHFINTKSDIIIIQHEHGDLPKPRSHSQPRLRVQVHSWIRTIFLLMMENAYRCLKVCQHFISWDLRFATSQRKLRCFRLSQNKGNFDRHCFECLCSRGKHKMPKMLADLSLYCSKEKINLTLILLLYGMLLCLF